MKIHASSNQGQGAGEQDDKGFTLIEILIAIVLVGILSAVAVVGISNLVSKGSNSACGATKDSASAGSAVYFAANGVYPADFLDLTKATAAQTGPPAVPAGSAAMTLPTGVTPNPPVAGTLVLKNGTSWTLTMTAGSVAAPAPTFQCT
jgi:prepilin-type N-terminal cleavage/methylation domain-containing protein